MASQGSIAGCLVSLLNPVLPRRPPTLRIPFSSNDGLSRQRRVLACLFSLFFVLFFSSDLGCNVLYVVISFEELLYCIRFTNLFSAFISSEVSMDEGISRRLHFVMNR